MVDQADIFLHINAHACPKGLYDNLPAKSLAPVPEADWPAWAKAVATFRGSTDAGVRDVGVGDTVARKLGVLGEAFKAMMRALGAPCGCEARAERMNRAYPYPTIEGR
jgi:hypothetical protein